MTWETLVFLEDTGIILERFGRGLVFVCFCPFMIAGAFYLMAMACDIWRRK